MQKSPDIRDVARLAGVSVATVSRTFSTPEIVRPSTRERVLQAASSLGYRPSLVARGLITGRTSNLGMVVPDLSNPFFPPILKAAQARAREFGRSIFLADTDEDPDAEHEIVRAMLKQVDGFILCSSRMPDEQVLEVARMAPLVLFNRPVPGVAAVLTDFAGGIEQALEHLAGLGHRRCAYVGGPSRSWGNGERVRGIASAAGRLGLDVVDLGRFAPRYESGVEAAALVVETTATAVLAYNDLIAMGLLAGLGERGLRVPGDISVVGYDDIDMAAMCQPPLTTVAIPTRAAGRRLTELLLGETDGQPPAIETALTVRASTGPAPAARRPARAGR